MDTSLIAVHLLMQPKDPTAVIPTTAHPAITSAIKDLATSSACTLHEMSLQKDHLHILLTISDEKRGAFFISSSVLSLSEILLDHGASHGMSDHIHVTLLPPWHVDILASFLRDQDRYHKTHSVEEEISQVFQPQEPGIEISSVS